MSTIFINECHLCFKENKGVSFLGSFVCLFAYKQAINLIPQIPLEKVEYNGYNKQIFFNLFFFLPY